MTKIKILAFLVTLAIIGIGVLIGANKLARWFDYNTLRVQSPVAVKAQPVVVVSRRVNKTIVVKPENEKVTSKAKDKDLAEYICSKDWNCEVAVALATAESGMREGSVNLNKGHSLDVGIFQINLTYHGHRKGCSLKELSDKYKNVDCAYSIYLEQGFEPWVAYTNGMYLAHLKGN